MGSALIAGGPLMPPSHVLIYGFICRVSGCSDIPSGPLVSPQPDRCHSARPVGLVDRSRPAARCAVGAIQGILGRSLGSGADPRFGASERCGLLGGLDARRRSGAHARRLLRGAADQGRGDAGAYVAAFRGRSSCQRRLGLRHRALLKGARSSARVAFGT